ncbi:MAG: CopG family transcriptional regulator [Candidatus Omnitrophica bacterium]|nr:CopG family transcriptional regulator [Candidatus Omnitrophota bacterium]
MTRIPDFLPPPEALIVPGEASEKVTIVLKRSSVDFFRRKAKEHHTKYQRMIREVLDRYARQYAS